MRQGCVLGWVATAMLILGAAEGPRERPLGTEVPLTGELSAGERHVYTSHLTAGAWLWTVEQRGIDVEVEVTGPGAASLGVVDSPLDRRGDERFLVVAAAAGGYRVEVRSREVGAPPGRYGIRLAALGRATPEDRQRLAALRASFAAARLYRQGSAESWRQAVGHLQRAADGWRRLADREAEAFALYRRAVLHRLLGESAEALEIATEVLPLWQALGERSWQANTLNEIGLDLWQLDRGAAARDNFARALDLHRATGDLYGEAVALSNLCLMRLSSGELRRGLDCYLEALPGLERVGAPALEATARSNAGRAHNLLGEPQAALDQYAAALALVRATGDRRGEARALNNLAVLHRGLGEPQAALVHYSRALRVFRQLEDRRWQARVLGNIGLAYYGLGEPRRALAFLRQALDIRRDLGERRGEAATLADLGLVQNRLGDYAAALESLELALQLRRDAGDRRGEAIAWMRLSQVKFSLDDATALTAIDRALDILRTLEDRPNEAVAWRRKGEIHTWLAESGPAVDSLRRALELAREVKYPVYEAQALFALAKAERRFGRPDAARRLIEAAVTAIEALRGNIHSPELRASFAGMKHRAYAFYIDLLMAAHRAAPRAGHAVRALEVSERARQRSLLDLLQEADADLRAGVDSGLLARQRELQRRLSARAGEVLRRRDLRAQEAAGFDAEQLAILRDLDAVEAEIRRRSPRYAALTRPQPLAAAEMQGLLDRETLLLSYALGSERSFLWAVTEETVTSFELPARAVIEAAVRRIHDRLSHFDVATRNAETRALAELGEVLLGPLRQLPQRSRLAVVPDGALHYLPFAALVLPPGESAEETGDRPLRVVERYETAVLPSASALALQRRTLAGRRPATKRLAVLADPVFSPDDATAAAPGAESGLSAGRQVADAPGAIRGETAAPAGAGARRFARLPATRREAEALAALAAPEPVFLGLDFAARRDNALGDRLADYRVVHFATHGVIDAETPALSGLALSQVSETGEVRDGFLSLADIYGMRLGADLVVLSGCRTALGRELRGEGLIGLTRGFMYAGSPRVVASLWQVEDRATAALMTELYRGMWRDGLRPAAALRAAQLTIRRQRRWRDPYFWSGFVLQGDWR